MAKRAPRAKPAPTVVEFIAELLADETQEITYNGLVKATDDADPKALMFAQRSDPTHWVRLSEDAIARVERLPDVTILGRRWRAARIVLKAPATPAEVSLSKLAEFHQLSFASPRSDLTSIAFAAHLDTIAAIGGACPKGYTKIVDENGNPHCIKDQDS